MVPRPPPRTLLITPLFFFFFLFKVWQTPLKSLHLSPFVPSVILGRIKKSENGRSTTTPHFSDQSPFFKLFCLFKVQQTPLKSVHLSPFVPSVIWGRIKKFENGP